MYRGAVQYSIYMHLIQSRFSLGERYDFLFYKVKFNFGELKFTFYNIKFILQIQIQFVNIISVCKKGYLSVQTLFQFQTINLSSNISAFKHCLSL